MALNVKHLYVALAAAIGAGLYVIPKEGAVNWRAVAIDAGSAALAALGYRFRKS